MDPSYTFVYSALQFHKYIQCCLFQPVNRLYCRYTRIYTASYLYIFIKFTVFKPFHIFVLYLFQCVHCTVFTTVYTLQYIDAGI